TPRPTPARRAPCLISRNLCTGRSGAGSLIPSTGGAAYPAVPRPHSGTAGGLARPMHPLARAALAAALVLLAGCGIHVPDGVTRHIDTAARPDGFIYCYGHGCGEKATVRFSRDQWEEVRALFAEPAVDPEEERRRIAE